VTRDVLEGEEARRLVASIRSAGRVLHPVQVQSRAAVERSLRNAGARGLEDKDLGAAVGLPAAAVMHDRASAECGEISRSQSGAPRSHGSSSPPGGSSRSGGNSRLGVFPRSPSVTGELRTPAGRSAGSPRTSIDSRRAPSAKVTAELAPAVKQSNG
jgi:hypothetical protein